ncbi:MAG: hypothetical protein UT63_C0003G0002 [Candidatus Gottesmanbacteria bacterium GW2011_GWC2_39_8]|uniref:Sugar 3,4-ketoisomerase QdtA cupin domain-containing protein n=1 Tax=Candidatus Gottesmanbacteria bacterium GW2011_GWC2_39_8 TaxID=1618450 RepID=A0A0G0QAC7_9BACT|nr:MAG: hypothetical protein UT63_C0003G0002 [Candidatus Gottesmanbacteria bacterium GW2011_GWC2_39_8]
MKGFEKIIYKDKEIAMVFRGNMELEGIKFFTDEMNPFQIGIHNRPKGVKLNPHIHKMAHALVIKTIQEVLFVQRGKIRVNLFTKAGEKIQSVVLVKGDSILLMGEAHGVDILEDSYIFEIKQGPYPGTEHAKIYLKT